MDNLKDKIYSNISYTNQDYESILTEFKDILQGGIQTSWNNLAETDIIMILMSVFAAHKDILNYMIDYRTLEGFMSTAKERQSIVRIANSFGYKIPSFKAGMAEFSIDAPAYLEFGTQLADSDNIPWVYFDFSKPFILDELVKLYQGTLYNVTIDMTQVNNINKTYILPSPSIAIGSTYQDKRLSKLILTKSDESTEEFIEVDNLYRYNGDSTKVYELNVDPQGITYIRFHKDLNLLSYASDTLTFYYVVTTGKLSTNPNIITITLPIDDTLVTLEERNLYPTANFFNGADPLVSEEVKENFKHYYASSDLLITQDDIKNFVLNIQTYVNSVNRCIVIDKQFDTEGFASRGVDIPLGEVRVYVLKNNNLELTPTEADVINAEINKYKMSGITIIVNDALARRDITINLGFAITNNEPFKEFLINYINNLPIGSIITAGQINEVINNSIYSRYFNSNNGSVKLQTSLTELNLSYNEYANLTATNIIV